MRRLKSTLIITLMLIVPGLIVPACSLAVGYFVDLGGYRRLNAEIRAMNRTLERSVAHHFSESMKFDHKKTMIYYPPAISLTAIIYRHATPQEAEEIYFRLLSQIDRVANRNKEGDDVFEIRLQLVFHNTLDLPHCDGSVAGVFQDNKELIFYTQDAFDYWVEKEPSSVFQKNYDALFYAFSDAMKRHKDVEIDLIGGRVTDHLEDGRVSLNVYRHAEVAEAREFVLMASEKLQEVTHLSHDHIKMRLSFGEHDSWIQISPYRDGSVAEAILNNNILTCYDCNGEKLLTETLKAGE